MINIPIQLAVPLYDAVINDASAAIKKVGLFHQL
jgi:hypothetical protein